MARHFITIEGEEPIVLSAEQSSMLLHLLDEYKKHMDEAAALGEPRTLNPELPPLDLEPGVPPAAPPEAVLPPS